MEISPNLTDNVNPKKPMLFPLSDRQIVELKGKDSLDYLQRISTADFRSLPPGKAQHTLFLGRDGRILAECVALNRGREDFDLIVPKPCLKHLMEVLELYHFGEDISYASNPDRKPYLLLGSVPASIKYPEGIVYATGEWGTLPAIYIISSTEVKADVLGAESGTADKLLGLRIKNLVPEFGFEIVPGKTIPLEVNQKSLISFTKGCYPGQETIARIYNLGHPANVLVQLQLESDVSPAQANLFSSDEKNVGSITSVFHVPGSNRYECLAIVKWAYRDKGVTLNLEDLPAKPQATIMLSTGKADK